MRVALYPRVSNSYRDQDPEKQLVVLRAFCEAQCWQFVNEHVDDSVHVPRGNWASLE